MEKVIIHVRGGMAYINEQTSNVEVEIIDWDNIENDNVPLNYVWQYDPLRTTPFEMYVVCSLIDNIKGEIVAQIWAHGRNEYSLTTYEDRDFLNGNEHQGKFEELQAKANEIFRKPKGGMQNVL